MKSFTNRGITISLGIMKPLPAAGFVAAGMAAGILLGRGPAAREGSTGGDSDNVASEAHPTKSGRPATASLHPGVQTIRRARPGELAALTEQATTMTDPVEIRRLLSECLLHMTAENWQDVVATFGKISRTSGRDPADEWKLALFRSGQVAGAEAMESYLADGLDKGTMRSWHTLYGWAARDPGAALAWLGKAEAEGHHASNELYAAVISGAALSNPEEALKLLDQLPADRRSGCAGNLVWNVVQNGGTQALDAVLQYAAALDPVTTGNASLASELFHEVTEKLLWQADHARDVPQACEVVTKLAGYGRDPNGLTLAVLQKYRYYFMPDKLDILETVNASPQGAQLQLASLTSTVLRTMNGDGDRAAVREWMQQHPDSPLIPHLTAEMGEGE